MNFYRIRRFKTIYDEATAFVVRARDEADARRIVYQDQHILQEKYGDSALKPALWLDPEFASCELVPVDGEPEIILVDFLHA